MCIRDSVPGVSEVLIPLLIECFEIRFGIFRRFIIQRIPIFRTHGLKNRQKLGDVYKRQPQRDPNYSRYNGYTVDLYQKLVDKNGKTISTTLLLSLIHIFRV